MSELNSCVSPFGISSLKKGPFANPPAHTLQSHPGDTLAAQPQPLLLPRAAFHQEGHNTA